MINGIDVSDPTRAFTNEEWEALRFNGGQAYNKTRISQPSSKTHKPNNPFVVNESGTYDGLLVSVRIPIILKLVIINVIRSNIALTVPLDLLDFREATVQAMCGHESLSTLPGSTS